jgi:hypothetical protein
LQIVAVPLKATVGRAFTVKLPEESITFGEVVFTLILKTLELVTEVGIVRIIIESGGAE